MFGSISIVNPNTTVTSSFTATEACRVGVEDGYTVRVNQQATSSRLIDLKVGDKIEIDVLSLGANEHKFVPWTYNGNPSYFAVVSNAGAAKPTLRSQYRNKTWIDILPTFLNGTYAYQSNTGSERAISLSNTSSGYQATDLANVLNPKASSIHFFRDDGVEVYRLQTDAPPISHTTMWNGASNTWESYALDSAGYIYTWDSRQVRTKSTGAYVGARTLFSDGVTLYVGGEKFVWVLSDITTLTRTIPAPEAVMHGMVLGNTIIVTTATGKAMKLEGNSFTTLFQADAIGVPTVFKDQFIFPITDQYKLSVYDSLGTFIRDISTGDMLPWAVAAYRGSRLAVTGADTPQVQVFNDLGMSASVYTFSKNVSYAVPLATSVIGSFYLNDYQLTVPPNPEVTGPAFKTWKAPLNVVAGSGEYTINTLGENLPSFVSPNARMLINGSATLNAVSQGSAVQIYQEAFGGRVSACVVLGNYAFDFKVESAPSDTIATFINTGVKSKAAQLVWTFKVPKKVVNAPIALSVGTLLVDGQPYNGRSPVNAGQDLKITINVPKEATYFSSVLSIADAQYPLIMGSASQITADIQKFQPYGSTEVFSSYVIVEAGNYDFPDYLNARVRKNNETVSFPTQLAIGDEITVRHIQASSWWLDERDTVLIGPTANYYFKSFTTVDDMPENVDFGTVHHGIPDFYFPGDLTPVITGLSEDYQIRIYNKYMQFSVNGGVYETSPLVGNGDKVQALYRVKNLFEVQPVKTLLADGVTVYEFGYLNIDPAEGQWMPPRSSLQRGGSNQWNLINGHLELVSTKKPEVQKAPDKYMEANKAVVQQAPEKYMRANTPVIQQTGAPSGKASIGMWIQTSSPPGKASVGMRFQANSPPGNASVGEWQGSADQRTTGLPRGVIFSTSVALNKISTSTFNPFSNYILSRKVKANVPVANTFLNDQRRFKYEDQRQSIRLAEGSQQLYEPSFGISGTFTKFTPVFHHESTLSQRRAVTFFTYQATKGDRIADVAWRVMPIGLGRRYEPGHYHLYGTVLRYHQRLWADFTYKNDKVYEPGHFYMEDRLVRWIKINPVYLYASQVRVKQIVGFAPAPNSQPFAITGSRYVKPVFRETAIKGKAVAVASAKKVVVAGAKPISASQISVDRAAFGESAINWQTFLPLQTGGFATAGEAEFAATAYNNVLPLTVYQQPEGTFSYVFKRNTELVCQIKGTNIFAVKWLIGGG